MQQTIASNQVVTGIIDGDGHIFERDDDFYPYLQHKYPRHALTHYYLFPTLDGRRRVGRGNEWGFSPEAWLSFLDHAGISETVLYPTAGLGFAFLTDPVWANDLARAYNDYIADAYLKASPRFKAVGIIPIQDPNAAAQELHRIVTELGMLGAVLPAVGLPVYYGDRSFDPLYEVAQRLGTLLGVHGAPRLGVGLDNFRSAPPAALLAHPFSQMSQFMHMMTEQVFERFPNLKVAFLEAGCGWLPYLLERLDRSARPGRTPATQQIMDHPIYFHAELEEDHGIAATVSMIGDDRLTYASDFPHEGVDDIVNTLNEFLNRADVSQTLKEKILRNNIKAMYSLG